MNNRITICYPTFNRFEAIDKRIEELLADNLFDRFDVLIIDNDSPDDTFRKLKNKYSYPNLEILKNETNVGFAMSIVRLIEKSTTDYIAFYSDEDFPNLDGLTRSLESTDYSELSFLVGSVAAPPNKNLKHTRLCESGRCSVSQAHSASYISGLLFKKKTASLFLQKIKESIHVNKFVEMYPHVALMMALHPLGDGYSTSELLAYRRDKMNSSLPKMEVSSIKEEKTVEILELSSLNGRWKNWLDGLNFLVSLSKEMLFETNISYRNKLADVIDHHCSILFPTISMGIRMECPEAGDIFTISMYNQITLFLSNHGKKTEVDYSRAISVLNKRKPRVPELLKIKENLQQP